MSLGTSPISTPSLEGFTPSTIKAISKDPTQKYVWGRNGSVLRKGMILKNDSYWDRSTEIGNFRQGPVLSGAPFFRQLEELNICVSIYYYTKILACYAIIPYSELKLEANQALGVGQPTIFGIRTIMNTLYHKHKKLEPEKKLNVVWINLRVEPIIYVNGRPMSPREIDHPRRNLDFSGLSPKRVSQMEDRLKKDIIAESEKYDGNVLIHDEVNEAIVPCWEAIFPSSVLTPQEVFAQIEKEGFSVQFKRVPLSPEEFPNDNQTLDYFIEHLKDIPEDSYIIFNCQQGRGRSTTGMVIATLLQLHKHRLNLRHSQGKAPTKVKPDSENLLRSGEYHAISNLMRVTTNGYDIKNQVDAVINLSGTYINLKDIIFKARAQYSTSFKGDELHLVHARNHLQRYFYIILFCSYLKNEVKDGTFEDSISFAEWMEKHGELKTILEQIQKNPEDALESPTTTHTNEKNALQISRKGQFLSRETILKTDWVKKVDTSYPLYPLGVPNFRSSLSFPHLFGTGSCTKDQVEKVLRHINREHPISEKVNWFFLRDEPMVYLDGVPHVLRDSKRPQHNLNNFYGISVSRLTQIEQDLKSEVLDELNAYSNKLLIHDEIKVGQVQSRWVEIKLVQTPKEFFESFQSITFFRLPLASGRSITEHGLDMFNQLATPQVLAKPTVFSCQTGRARSTMATIIAHLILAPSDDPEFCVFQKKNEYKPILALLRVLKNGQNRRLLVDSAIVNCGSKYNLLAKMSEFRQKYLDARTPEEAKLQCNRSVYYIER